MSDLSKAEPRTLYVSRKVLNAAEIIKWAKAQGFKTTLPAADLHVTVCYSRTPIDWMKAQEAWTQNENGELIIRPGGPRVVEPLGDKGAIVLMFASSELGWRHMSLKEIGASWDHQEYQPHITLTYDGGEVDLETIQPYRGKIKLGPEVFEEVDDAWTDDLVEKNKGVYGSSKSEDGTLRFEKAQVAKVDEELGLVFGYAIVCKEDGRDYFDLNVDRETGEKVPEHIPEETMLKAAAEFMDSATRPGNEMHAGPQLGKYVFAFPLTTEIAKALGIKAKKTGLLVAYKAPADVLQKFKDGTYTGFSIEGSGTGREIHA